MKRAATVQRRGSELAAMRTRPARDVEADAGPERRRAEARAICEQA